MRQAVVLDMDGLMVDTEPLSYRAWQRLAAEYGYALDDALYARMVGRRSDQSTRIFLAGCPLPLSPAEVIARKTAYFEELRADGVPVMPGLGKLMTAVASLGLPWAVATSSPRHHAESILAQLGLTPVALAAGAEAANGKPAPDIYLLAAARLGVDPAGCLAVEDSLPGCQAAMAAGMLATAVPNGITRQADFSSVPFVFDSLNEVAVRLPFLLTQ